METNEKKSVRIDPLPVVYTTPERLEKSVLWLTKKEYRDIRSHERNLMQQVCQGLFVEGDYDSFRGLEARMTQEKRRMEGVGEVFQEQNMQTDLGYYDVQAIAQIYARCTKEAAQFAHEMAKMDARVATAIHQEKSRPSKRFDLFRRRSSKPLKPTKSFRDFSFTAPRIFRRTSVSDDSSVSGQHNRAKKRPTLECNPKVKETMERQSTDNVSIDSSQKHTSSLNISMPNLPAQQISRRSFIDSSSITTPRSIRRASLDSEKGERANSPSQIPFVGEPPQISLQKHMKSTARQEHFLSLISLSPSTALKKTIEPRSPPIPSPKRPSFHANARKTLENNDDITARTVSSQESTSGFLMKPMYARTCV